MPKLGFKPKFKPASAPIDNMPLIPEDQADPEVKTGDGSPKLGFKPKFKTAMPKPVPGIEVQTEAEVKDTESQKPVPEIKPAYVPKFQARNLKPKTGDSE